MRFDDPEVVRREYASEERFLRRRVTFVDYVHGPNAEELALEAAREVRPRQILEVGGGTGAFAQRLHDELGADVVVIDISPRMVELTRGRGLTAAVGDVANLPFDDGKFDVVVANWVLHHAPDLDRALEEVNRVLEPGGRLAAATFADDDIVELWELLGDRTVGGLKFSRENGERALRRHFDHVERRDADGVVVFPDRPAVLDFLANLMRGGDLAANLPEFAGDFRARSRQSAFVADKAAL